MFPIYDKPMHNQFWLQETWLLAKCWITLPCTPSPWIEDCRWKNKSWFLLCNVFFFFFECACHLLESNYPQKHTDIPALIIPNGTVAPIKISMPAEYHELLTFPVIANLFDWKQWPFFAPFYQKTTYRHPLSATQSF